MPARRRLIAAFVAVAICAGGFGLAGCGQTGPLYLPRHKAKHSQAPAATSAPPPLSAPSPAT